MDNINNISVIIKECTLFYCSALSDNKPSRFKTSLKRTAMDEVISSTLAHHYLPRLREKIYLFCSQMLAKISKFQYFKAITVYGEMDPCMLAECPCVHAALFRFVTACPFAYITSICYLIPRPGSIGAFAYLKNATNIHSLKATSCANFSNKSIISSAESQYRSY